MTYAYRRSEYGPFEVGKTYELEYRARVEYRGELVNRDLSDEAIEIHVRLYRLPLEAPATFVVDVTAEKLVEEGSAAGETGLFLARLRVPKTEAPGSVVLEVVLIDTGVADTSTKSAKREIALADPARTAIISGPTS